MIEVAGSPARFSLDEVRGDVVRRLYPEGGEGLNAKCGFRVELDQSTMLRVGFLDEGSISWRWAIDITPLQKVVEGGSGWLFLDNDSNASVDQYEGRRLLTSSELARWADFLEVVAKTAESRNIPWRLLIAPAKEMLYPDMYPFKRGEQIPVGQFLHEFNDRFPIVWPLSQLAQDRELSYWKGDTHWTDFGAALAAQSAAEAFGASRAVVLGRESFRFERRAGDLGGKFSPPRLSWLLSVADLLTRDLVFDNGIHNHGRVRIYRSSSAASGSRCLVLGDSFGVNLSPWLASAFDEVVFIHTAASFDPALIDLVKPTHLLLQTNSRFLISPAKTDYQLEAVIRSKSADVSTRPPVFSGALAPLSKEFAFAISGQADF